ncbi:uncharacterized protein DNG_07533 [Cephalotrichum gorgonifer]
MTMFK